MFGIKTIGIFAHVDSGKTTLAEKILSFSKGERSSEELGNFDFHEIEKKRGITVFSEQATIEWKGKIINIIDTPGHSDFFSELERSTLPIDVAILVVSASDGITAHTRKIWNILREKHIPSVIFANKLDQVFWNTSDIKRTLKELHSEVVFVGDLVKGRYRLNFEKTSFLEKLAELDEDFLESYLSEEKTSRMDIEKALKKQVALGKLFPVITGSAKLGIGVSELLDVIADFFPDYEKDDDGPFWGLIYKIKNDSGDGRLSYIKILSGSVGTRELVLTGEVEQKIVDLRRVFGVKQTSVERGFSGELVVARGLEGIMAGEYIGILAPSNFCQQKGMLVTVVKAVDAEDERRLLEAIEVLEDEDRNLEPLQHSDRGITITVNGTTQIEVLKDVFASRFDLKVIFLPPVPKYRETVKIDAKGFCHYEPKKHYAEVEVLVSKNPGGGNVYHSELSSDILPAQYQSQIEKTVNEEAFSRGVLAGFPLIDVKITLIGGKYHLEHTHGGDFRIATIRAVRSALEKSGPIIMEPFYKFNVKVPQEYFGNVVSEILNFGGIISEQFHNVDFVDISGNMPVSSSVDYPAKLDVASDGKGYVIFEPGGYLECRNFDPVVRLGIEESDNILYNSVSIFREKKKMKKVKGI